MDGAVGNADSAAAQATEHERSTGELVNLLSEQVSALVRDELKLAQLEVTRKGKQAGMGAGMLGVAGLTALYAAGCLLAGAIIAISAAVAPWLAALIVGVALLGLAGIAAMVGWRRLRGAAPPVPTQAVASMKADVQEIKERVRR